MDAINSLLTVAVAGILLSASPGLSMTNALSRSVQFGQSGGLVFSCGLAVGGMLHAVFAALGVSVIVIQAPWLLQTIKYLGALFLTYLAYDAFKASLDFPPPQRRQAINLSPTIIDPKFRQQSQEHAYRSLFINGVLIELSNPKTIIFFLSFMPQFVQHFSTMGMFLLSSLIPITAIPADLLAIFAGGLIANRVRGHAWLMQAVNLLVALVLLGIAGLVLWV